MPVGPIYDTMIAASVIDENRQRYTLDALARDYLDEEKYKYDLAERSKEEHGISDPMSNMHLLPYDLVVDYAEQDVALTLKLWNLIEFCFSYRRMRLYWKSHLPCSSSI